MCIDGEGYEPDEEDEDARHFAEDDDEDEDDDPWREDLSDLQEEWGNRLRDEIAESGP